MRKMILVMKNYKTEYNNKNKNNKNNQKKNQEINNKNNILLMTMV